SALGPLRAGPRGRPLAADALPISQDAVRAGVDGDGRDVAPPNDSVTVDDEQRSLAEPVALAVHAVAPRHRPLGLEVREQGEVELALVSERSVAPGTIHRDRSEEHT